MGRLRFILHHLKNMLSVSLVMCALFVTGYAFADATVVTPTDFLKLVSDTVQSFGGLSWMLKVAAVITVLISSMKVTFLNGLVWSKLGKAQAWVAPILGLVGGLVGLAGHGPLTLQSAFAFLSAGAGAIILHELLDTVKALPGIGPVWVGLIDAIEKATGGPAAQPTPPTTA
jgi:hypothetical protein